MPRTRDLEGQQRRLSSAVWSVLAERGLPGLTVRAVAERAGCSTGLVMHAFPDKRALLVHARTLLHDRTAARADAAERRGAAQDKAGRDATELDEAERDRGGHAGGWDMAGRDGAWAVLDAVLGQAVSAADEAKVWVGFLAAALGDAELAALHRRYNRAFIDRIARLAGACRPDWDAATRAREAKALIALVEGLNTLAAVDPAAYPATLRRAAVTTAVLLHWSAPVEQYGP